MSGLLTGSFADGRTGQSKESGTSSIFAIVIVNIWGGITKPLRRPRYTRQKVRQAPTTMYAVRGPKQTVLIAGRIVRRPQE